MILDNNLNWHKNSAFPNSDWTNSAKYIVDDNSELANKIINNCPHGFTPVEDKDGNLIDVTPKEQPIEQLKTAKLVEISKACEKAIVNGVDMNNEHFSYAIVDQLNIEKLIRKIENEKISKISYQSDNGEYKNYSVKDFQHLINMLESNVLYQRAYHSLLKKLINQCATIQEVQAITYGMKLSEDLQNHLNEMLGVD